MGEEYVWQPGEQAIYTDWAGKGGEPVEVIRYSRSRFSMGRLVLVKRKMDGKRFTIHQRFLSAPPAQGQ